MRKKIVFSVRQNHDIIEKVTEILKDTNEFEFIFHDPTNNFFNLGRMPKEFKEADFYIIKVRNQCSIDLLHYANLYNIPALHDLHSVLTCKNKIALDYNLRAVYAKYNNELKEFSLPVSWNQNPKNRDNFKKWAKTKLPLVLKSHNQHDKYNRFNFLVRKIADLKTFYDRYKELVYYDIYVQKFIECDGIERKIYAIGDRVFGIQRENPIYLFMRENPQNIDVERLVRKQINITPEIKLLTKHLSKELKLKIFGFDLIKSLEDNQYYLVDLNDFPGFKGIKNVEKVLANYILDCIRKL